MNGNSGSATASMRRVQWVAVSMPYDPAMVERFKELFPLRAFDKATKEWLLPAERAQEARALLQERFGRVVDEAPPRAPQNASQGGYRPGR
jgi:hypothetical protein